MTDMKQKAMRSAEEWSLYMHGAVEKNTYGDVRQVIREIQQEAYAAGKAERGTADDGDWDKVDEAFDAFFCGATHVQTIMGEAYETFKRLRNASTVRDAHVPPIDTSGKPVDEWKETVRDIYDACLLKYPDITRLIETRHHDFFCVGKPYSKENHAESDLIMVHGSINDRTF